MFGQCKQRQVDVLTKSSLRLLRDRTRVYIQRDFTSHERGREAYGMEEGRSEENRTLAKWIAKRALRWNSTEWNGREGERTY